MESQESIVPSSSIKRKFLTIEEKVELIDYSENHKLPIRQLAEKFKIGKTQVNAIMKNKAEIRKLYAENGNPQKKRKFPKGTGAAIDAVVFDWFCDVRNKNIPLSGRIIKEKALEVAKELNIEFKASNGWLEKFCQRHNIALKSICKEGVNFKENEVDEWKKKLVSVISAFRPNNLFNSDETGLFYNALANRTLALKNERLSSESSDEESKADNLESDREEDENLTTTVSNIFEAHSKLKDLESFFVLSGDLVATQKIIVLLSHVESEIVKTKFSKLNETHNIEDYFSKQD